MSPMYEPLPRNDGNDETFLTFFSTFWELHECQRLEFVGAIVSRLP